MKRNIILNYKLNEAKTVLTIELEEETKKAIIKKVIEFDLIQLDEESILYNKALDEFDAEYDDELAPMLDKLIHKATNEN